MEFYSLPQEVEYIISSLNMHGYRADVVGGPVRDFLLSKLPIDYDITTSAFPAQIKEVFRDYRTVDTGIKHGTVTVVINGHNYEITTYRIDGEYRDSRHPEEVFFTEDIETDLARRDFTMNAIAYNHKDGITDPFFGRRDIENKLIRAVGDPERRFTEDALRILRAIRFAAVLGFEIEKETAKAIINKKHLLADISAERIWCEWKKLLAGEWAYGVIVEYLPVIAEFLPELSELSMPSRALFDRADYMTRFLSVFYLSTGGGRDKFEAVSRRLRTDAKTRTLGGEALSSVSCFNLSDPRDLARAMNRLDIPAVRQLVGVEIALGNYSPDVEKDIESFLESPPPYRISDLEIGGNDLISLGIYGKDVGDTLNELLLLVIDGECENEREALLSKALELSRNKKIK